MAERYESAPTIATPPERRSRKPRVNQGDKSSTSAGELTTAIYELVKEIQTGKQSANLARSKLMYWSGHGKSAHVLPIYSPESVGSYPQGSYLLSPENNIAFHYDIESTIRDCNYDLLEAHRSDLASLARFSQRVEHATFHLVVVAVDSSSHQADEFVDRLLTKVQFTSRIKSHNWYGKLASLCFSKWETARDMLVLDAPLPAESEPLYRTAFWSLCELTPADTQLKLLFEKDRSKASRELVRHVDAYANQLALAADLARTMANEDEEAESSGNDQRLATIQNELLAKTGEQLTLTKAAARLGMTRQGLYKRIGSGNALGLMKGGTFVIPEIQLVEIDGKCSVVDGLPEVLKLFSRAGGWSALQYLIEPDPALGGNVPIDLLKEGKTEPVIIAARTYLGLDEG